MHWKSFSILLNFVFFCILEPCFEDGIAYWGHSYKESNEKDPSSCQKACLNNSKCIHWTFHKPSSKCFLKDDLTQIKYDTNFISGPKDCLTLPSPGKVIRAPTAIDYEKFWYLLSRQIRSIQKLQKSLFLSRLR